MTCKLRVWWIPQVPGEAFYMPVDNVVEGKLLLDTLAQYDLFQYDNRIKPDYANAGGLQYLDEEDNEWWDYYVDDKVLEITNLDKENIDDFTLEEIRDLYSKGVFN